MSRTSLTASAWPIGGREEGGARLARSGQVRNGAFRTAGLPLAQEQIHDPAAAHVRARFPAVVEDVGVDTPRFLQSVTQDRQPSEDPILVDGACQSERAAGDRRRTEDAGSKRVPEDAPEQPSLCRAIDKVGLFTAEMSSEVPGAGANRKAGKKRSPKESVRILPTAKEQSGLGRGIGTASDREGSGTRLAKN